MTRRVLVVMAMRAEADPIISALTLAPVSSPQPHLWYAGPAASIEVMIAVNGVDPRFGVDSIGTVPAALNTAAAIDHFRPDLVISAGTAGGWARSNAAVGDVYLSGSFVNHDRRIPLAGFDQYGVGRYDNIDVAPIADRLGFKTGLVTTSNSLDESPTDATHIRALGGVVKEMEAAAVAYVCELRGVPAIAIKTITDIVDGPEPTADQFVANLDIASSRLREGLVAVLLDLEAGRGL